MQSVKIRIYLFSFCFFHQPFSELVGVLQVGLLVCVAVLALVLLFEHGHGVTGVVGELVGVAGVERFAMAEILL